MRDSIEQESPLLTIPRSVEMCEKYPLTLLSKDLNKGGFARFVKPCESWLCRNKCAEEKAQVVLDHARTVFPDHVYLYSPLNMDYLPVLKKRRQRLHAGTLTTTGHRRSRMFASEPLVSSVGGYKTPPLRADWEVISKAEALTFLTGILTPGRIKVTRYDGAWKRNKLTQPSSYENLKIALTDTEFEKAWDDASSVVFKLTGILMEDPYTPPGEVSRTLLWDAFLDRAKRVKSSLRAVPDTNHGE